MSDSSHPAREPHDPASQELAAADPTEQGAPPPAGYDPADYRWVPVRRRPRYDGWTEEKQRYLDPASRAETPRKRYR